MRFFSLAAFIFFTAFCVVVAVSNRSIVSFSLHPLPFQWDMPLYLLLFAGIFIGLGAGALVVVGKSIKQSRHNHGQAKKIRDLEDQVKDLNPHENS